MIEEGAGKEDFVEVALDKKSDAKYRNPNLLYDHIMERTQDMGRKFYVFIDEIQLSYKVKNEDVDESLVPEEDRDMLYTTFYDILNDLMTQPNIDLYVTGSNSKMLSKDIVTNFRDRGSEIKSVPVVVCGIPAGSRNGESRCIGGVHDVWWNASGCSRTG